MEDDEQNDEVEVINDKEGDNEEEVLMDTPIGHEAVLMDAPAAQHDDDDAVSFHCTECNLTLASSINQLVQHDEGELFVMSLQR